MLHLLEKTILVSLIVILLLLGFRSFTLDFTQSEVEWGVSFDPYYTSALGFEPQKVFSEMMTDLKIDHLRLTAYWNRIEVEKDVYDWSELDWQMAEAHKYDAKVLLTVGRKLPRWPECYEPTWLNHLSQSEKEKELLEVVRLAVERYATYDNVIAWQVENEPLVGWFGVCPPPDKEELKKEIALVKSLDSRPIVVTDSGELSAWFKAASLTDILGTTMYRVVYNDKTGFWRWPLPPAYYHYKAKLVQRFTGAQKVIVTELQTEPWSRGAVQDDPLKYQYESMSPEQFEENLQYVTRAGFDTVYLWGVEWWYWMKETQGVDSYWQGAKELWN